MNARRALVAVIAVAAFAAAVPGTASAAASFRGAKHRRHGAKHYGSYRAVYEGSGKFVSQDTGFTITFHWSATYTPVYLTSKKLGMVTVGPIASGGGGGSWTSPTCNNAQGVLKFQNGPPSPEQGAITATVGPRGSESVSVELTRDRPFALEGLNNCTSADAATEDPFAGDPIQANVHEPMSVIGKAKIIDKVSSSRENFQNPGQVPAGMSWHGTVTLTKVRS